MANINKIECDCMGFYDGAGGCLPYDPAVHVEEPCPSNFFQNIGNWFSGQSQDQWVGHTNFGIQMCQLFGGCGGMGAGSPSDPNSPAYLMYLEEQRKKRNTMILIAIGIVAVILFAVARLKK